MWVWADSLEIIVIIIGKFLLLELITGKFLSKMNFGAANTAVLAKCLLNI